MLASIVFLAGTRLVSQFQMPAILYSYWVYVPFYDANATVRLWLKIGAAVPTVLILALAVRVLFMRPRDGLSVRVSRFGGTRPVKLPDPVRGLSDNHGHASWMTAADMAARFSGPNPVFGGIVIGENYRVDQDTTAGKWFKPGDPSTWGRGGKAPLLIDPCEEGPTHSITFTGPGGFKSMAAISVLLYWKGSAVVLDPSAELGPMLEQEKRLTNHQVIQLAVGGKQSFNVLDWIDTKSPLAETNVHAVVGWCFGEQQMTAQSSEDQFFRMWGKQLTACLLAHMLWSPDLPAHLKTVRTWRAGIATPQAAMRTMLAGVHTGSHSMMARQLAGTLMEIVDETFSGVYANANGGTSWLSVPAYADLLSGSSFRTADLLDGSTTVFVQIPSKTLQETPAVGRMVIGALLNQVYEAEGAVEGRVLFLLDEVFQLGYMKLLTVARDLGRKFGITLYLLYQSVGQLEQQWTREGRRAWYDAISWRAYGSVQDWETAKELSEACGNYAVVAISEGDNTGRSGKGWEVGSKSTGSNASRHEIRRALILPEELTQDARTDELFVIARGCKPMRLSRAIYFRRPEMVARVKTSRLIMNKGKALTS